MPLTFSCISKLTMDRVNADLVDVFCVIKCLKYADMIWLAAKRQAYIPFTVSVIDSFRNGSKFLASLVMGVLRNRSGAQIFPSIVGSIAILMVDEWDVVASHQSPYQTVRLPRESLDIDHQAGLSPRSACSGISRGSSGPPTVPSFHITGILEMVQRAFSPPQDARERVVVKALAQECLGW